jgi:hypothetical protein
VLQPSRDKAQDNASQFEDLRFDILKIADKKPKKAHQAEA